MAKVITHKCNSCGGPLTVSNKGGKYTCPFCGTINLFDSEQKNENGILCPQCGTMNPKDALHCGECGMKFNLPCPKCGAMNPAGTLYCVKCGANLQDELNRQQAIEARRLYVEAIKKEKREKKKKQARIVLPIYFACLLFLLAVIYYNNNLSAAARLRKDTALANSTRITQQAVEDLRSQYPYHGSNGIYSIYLKDVCIKYDATDQHWLSITHFIYTLDDPTMGFNWDFENTHMEDNLGNSYNVTYNTTYSGTGQVQNYFNGDATSATLHFKLAAESIPEIPIAIDLSDPMLTGTCQ